MSKKKYKYPLGTGRNGVVKHYIDSPQETLLENDMALFKAKEDARDNGVAKGLGIFGGMAVDYGLGMMANGVGAPGEEDTTGAGNSFSGPDNNSGAGGNSRLAAFGLSDIQNTEVEVEGKEVAVLPDGGLIDFKGPSHKDGGIDVNLPKGTDIFSKRIKVAGETMAERAKKRDSKMTSLENLLKKNDTDKVLKDTIKRTGENNDMEAEKDKRLQEVVKLMKQLTASGTAETEEQFADGGTVGGNLLRGMFGGTDADGNQIEGKLPNYTGGDLLGLAGTLYSAFEPMKNTKEARAGDTPNINAFEDFGQEGLATLENAKTHIGEQQDKALKDVEVSRTTSTNRNRGTARGVNTLRTLDLASDIQANEASGDIYDTFSKQMMGLLSKQAGFENDQDKVVMAGEDERDQRDRKDRDNYYTQLAQDIATKGQGIQQLGKMSNQIKKNEVSENLLNATSKGYKVDNNGNITLKDGTRELTVAEIDAVLQREADAQGVTLKQYKDILAYQQQQD
jgi:hypothetical protein